ncbi:uncharacterized protein [Triticum aestivum]|uniref:uncharacterized protein n=1 Tax=Triticum aestivum TaxID=4565 RepID=UPI001D015D32|nr:uncharacterized protein LOC123078264 [Triticum aestivum]
MEDAATSNPAPPNTVIDLPDDDEDEEPLKHRRSRKAPASKVPQDVSAPEILTVEGENTTRHTVTFATPLTSAQQPSLFTTHHVPEDQAGAAKEAIRQAGLMMEQLKTIRDVADGATPVSGCVSEGGRCMHPVDKPCMPRLKFPCPDEGKSGISHCPAPHGFH